MTQTPTVSELLDGHAVLDVECLDRIYLNGYVPKLQVAGQVVGFMTRHLGLPIPSPAIMEKIGTRFRQAVTRFARQDHIPVVKFDKTDRKIDRMRRYVSAQARTGRSGVAAIGVAQEYQSVFAATRREDRAVWFSFYKAERRVTCFYFYLWDVDFGPAFIKVCAYFPYPLKVWLNGHEWAKRQAAQAGIGFTELSNGFATCEDPQALQAICDRLGPGTIGVFFERWMSILPLPLTPADRDAGYWWELSMRQVETSRTIVFDAPRRARGFFEALVVDNLDIGRPDRRGHLHRPPAPTWSTAKGGAHLQDPHRHPRHHRRDDQRQLQALPGQAVPQGRPRPADRDRHQRPRRLDLQTTSAAPRGATGQGRDVNARLLDTERVGQGCVLASPAFERVARSTLTEDGRRSPALRFGDPRVMALFGALCVGLNALGFTNRSLRARVSQLLGVAYTVNQMSYDLHRLSSKGLIRRRPGTNTYDLTADGQRVAIFYTKVHDRLLGPLIAGDLPPAPPNLRDALATIDRHVVGHADRARLGRAA